MVFVKNLLRHTLNKIFHELGTHHSAYISNMVCMIKILVGKGDFEIKAKIKLESDLTKKKWEIKSIVWLFFREKRNVSPVHI